MKSERFELRFGEEALARIDQWREHQTGFPSRAEAVRTLVDAGLAKSSHKRVSFTDGEKLLILMMGELHKQLKLPEDDTDYSFLAKVIYGGHYWAPVWRMQGVFHGYEDDPRDLSVVLDVLDMWDWIERAYEKFPKKQRDKIEKDAAPFGKHVKFRGFDGNNESPLLGIAHFLVDEMERFSRFKGRELNAHMPTIAGHRRMLKVFAAAREKSPYAELTMPQVTAILNARKHPD